MIISEVVTAAADHAEKINAVATNQYVNQNADVMDVMVMDVMVMDVMVMDVMDGTVMDVMDGTVMDVMDGTVMDVMDVMAGTGMDAMAGTEMVGIMVMMEADMVISISLGMKPLDSGEADVTDIVSDMSAPQLTNSTELWATILLEEPDKNGLTAD